MKVMVVDGQGGGIGAALIKSLRAAVGNKLEILALGTNATATARMMKSGANRGGTGENAIVWTSRQADVIIGPVGVMMANAMMGEVTPAVAEAISSSRAPKILLPLNQEQVEIVGSSGEPLPHLVAKVVDRIEEMTIDV